ncbi:MAG: vanadium-dependent haloperoxidase, partial [Pseudomonadota bacterium]
MNLHQSRRSLAYQVRAQAAELAHHRVHPEHRANGDELRHRHGDPKHPNHGKANYVMTYTKGLPHDYVTGLVKDPDDVQTFVKAIDSGDPRDFIDAPLGACLDEHYLATLTAAEKKKILSECCTATYGAYWFSHKAKQGATKPGTKGGEPVDVRAWESQGAGNTFDLEGPDAQAVTMPPAPQLGSDELTAEMAEVYGQALLRDIPFTALMCKPTTARGDNLAVKKVIDRLNKLSWFADDDCCREPAERARSRGPLTLQNAFRGITPGDEVGPYISQFLLSGNGGVNGMDNAHDNADGYIAYGAIRADQRVRVATPHEDHMTLWSEWFDVQNGADLRGFESYPDCGDAGYRFITTPRDLATYVHYDALYEAYLNACLIMLGARIPLDPGIPFQAKDLIDHQQGFAHFGGPHILSLVTEVATRALKAVRYQKFNIHRRARPEVLAARMEKAALLRKDNPAVGTTFDALKNCGLLELVKDHNVANNKGAKGKAADKADYLLPMAFCEGSPMHPAYGAGHATVAGACVTILKAFFDHGAPLSLVKPNRPDLAFVPTADGQKLVPVDVVAPSATKPNECEKAVLTVEGELNKLASNISIGRDWAGVHYFTDYIESIRMGERIA